MKGPRQQHVDYLCGASYSLGNERTLKSRDALITLLLKGRKEKEFKKKKSTQGLSLIVEIAFEFD